ncbi:MAG: HIT family protein [Planctomycetota bacterium]
MTNPRPFDPDCIFCKIVAGQVPCRRVLETDLSLAFLDVGPLSRGHTLLIPKAHFATLDALDPDSAADLGRCLPTLCKAVAQAAGTPHCNVLQNNGAPAGQAVMHVHFHIIPKHPDGSGLPFEWPAGAIDDAAADALAASISRATH